MKSEGKQNVVSQPRDVAGLAEHLFRHESGRLVSVLTGLFGAGRIQLAEDVVQEALAKALQTWPWYGIPANPAAWLTLTARNLAYDILRRETNLRHKEPEVSSYLEQVAAGAKSDAWPRLESEIHDDSLRLMFACCHPEVTQEAQTALALKTLCGFSVGEIAKAFLTSESAIAKRLTRAKQRIRDKNIAFEIPVGDALKERLAGVMQTIYLLFNEGYKASSGDHLVREDLCSEAIRLATMLVSHPAGNNPEVHALLAMMLLSAARLPARSDADGNVLRLCHQDRSRWDRALISRGLKHIGRSAEGRELSAYHLQAAISACHCTAENYECTDWQKILWLYDRLMDVDGSPVVALNRAVAVAQVYGPSRGIEAVHAIRNQGPLQSYYLLYAVLAEFYSETGEAEQAIAHWDKAIALTPIRSEQDYLLKRMQQFEMTMRQG